ncbi:hypothetical protein [Bradyrhizobium cosmicum]|uniref:hypothetical protein n=1 Tax=Bradyrhizobium cosmicum TaxID=1404864 RepID=UPI0028EF15FB|nr:hypothetical protein [Bradyrhizobium cosmicum]
MFTHSLQLRFYAMWGRQLVLAVINHGENATKTAIAMATTTRFGSWSARQSSFRAALMRAQP